VTKDVQRICRFLVSSNNIIIIFYFILFHLHCTLLFENDGLFCERSLCNYYFTVVMSHLNFGFYWFWDSICLSVSFCFFIISWLAVKIAACQLLSLCNAFRTVY